LFKTYAVDIKMLWTDGHTDSDHFMTGSINQRTLFCLTFMSDIVKQHDHDYISSYHIVVVKLLKGKYS